MRSRSVRQRPYLTRKYQRARALLIERHGYLMAECADRKWCYRQLAALGWQWNVGDQCWRLTRV